MSPRVLTRRGARSLTGLSTRSSDDVRAATGQALNLLRVEGWVVVHEAAGSTGDHLVAGPGGVFVVGAVRARETPAGAVARLRRSAEEVARGLDVPVAALLCAAAAEPGPPDDVLAATPATIVDVLTSLPVTVPAPTVASLSRRMVTGRAPVAPGKRTRTGPAVAAEPVVEEPAPRRPRMRVRELVAWAVALAVLAVLAVSAPHAPQVVGWVRGLVTDPAHELGGTVRVAASTYHPELDVRVDRVTDVRAAGLARGERAVAVRIRLVDVGDEPWRTAAVRVRLVDSLGVSHGVASPVRPVGVRMLPASAVLRTGSAAEGYVVFAVPDDREPWKVVVRLAPPEDELVWALPH
jgi:hypothetical protein